jgi:hypothetical protein
LNDIENTKMTNTNNTLPSIYIEKFKEYQVPLAAFRKSSNLLLPTRAYTLCIDMFPLSNVDIKSLKIAATKGMLEVDTEDKLMYHCDNLIESQLGVPQHWAAYPIIDCLTMTLAAKDKELKRLEQLLDNKEYREKYTIKRNFNRRKYCTHLYASNVRFCIKDQPQKWFLINFGLKGKKDSDYHRAMQISYNPARFEASEIRQFFAFLDDMQVFQNYRKSMKDANITRIDIALDLVAVPTPLMIVANDRTENFSFKPDIPRVTEEDPCTWVQTHYVGSREGCYVIVYSKVDKVMAKGQRNIVMLTGPDTNPIYISRIERVYKPQKNGSVKKLWDIETIPYFLKGTNFYSPKAFKYIPQDQVAIALRKGYMAWAMDYYGPAFKAHRESMQRHLLNINHKWFKQAQTAALLHLKQMIIKD